MLGSKRLIQTLTGLALGFGILLVAPAAAQAGEKKATSMGDPELLNTGAVIMVDPVTGQEIVITDLSDLNAGIASLLNPLANQGVEKTVSAEEQTVFMSELNAGVAVILDPSVVQESAMADQEIPEAVAETNGTERTEETEIEAVAVAEAVGSITGIAGITEANAATGITEANAATGITEANAVTGITGANVVTGITGVTGIETMESVPASVQYESDAAAVTSESWQYTAVQNTELQTEAAVQEASANQESAPEETVSEEQTVLGEEELLTEAEEAVSEEEMLPEATSDLVMTNVQNSLNVRAEASEEAEKVGMLYKDCGGRILERRDGWTKLQSGELIGWASDEYLLFGAEAEALAEEVGNLIVTIQTDALRVRKEPSTEAGIYGLIPQDAELDVLEVVNDEWICVDYEGESGYISAEYVQMDFHIDEGETMEEIRAREEAEAREKAKLTENRGAVVAGADDTRLLAALIYCEAGNQGYEGQLAVGATVMNRVRSGAYPNSISGVIYASGQFPPALNGKVAKVYAGNVPDSCIQAAQAAIGGASNIGGATHFRRAGSRDGIVIGDHVFW